MNNKGILTEGDVKAAALGGAVSGAAVHGMKENENFIGERVGSGVFCCSRGSCRKKIIPHVFK